MLNILKIVPDTIVDGPRIRTSLYLSGCFHNCPMCHNKSSWKAWSGKNYENAEIIGEIKEYGHNQITITGGDGLCYQTPGLINFLQELRKEMPTINIWLYTGYTLEEILADQERKLVLDYIDVLVDGKFDESLKSSDCLFRGSTNQKIWEKDPKTDEFVISKLN